MYFLCLFLVSGHTHTRLDGAHTTVSSWYFAAEKISSISEMVLSFSLIIKLLDNRDSKNKRDTIHCWDVVASVWFHSSNKAKNPVQREGFTQNLKSASFQN